MDRHALLDTIRTGRGRLDALLAVLPDGRMLDVVNGEWTRKDVLAHIEAWERRTVELYRLLSSGRDPGTIGDSETDAVNARFFEQHRGRDLADIRAAEAGAYWAVLDLVESAPEADLFDPNRFAWTDGDPFFEWITGNTSEHYEEHIDQLAAGVIGVVGIRASGV
jgi:hypothetical protein